MKPLHEFRFVEGHPNEFACPVAFPKKYDAEGSFVKHYLPALRKFPAKYIYEPWKAPLNLQREAGCIIGVDYPKPIVDHERASKENMAKMKAAYDAHKAQASEDGCSDDDSATASHPPEVPKKRLLKDAAAGGGASGKSSKKRADTVKPGVGSSRAAKVSKP